MGEIKINLYIPIYTQDISKSFHFIWMKRICISTQNFITIWN